MNYYKEGYYSGEYTGNVFHPHVFEVTTIHYGQMNERDNSDSN